MIERGVKRWAGMRAAGLLGLATAGALALSACGALVPPQVVGDPLLLGSAGFRMSSLSIFEVTQVRPAALVAVQGTAPKKPDVLIAQGIFQGPGNKIGDAPAGAGSAAQFRKILAGALELPRTAVGSTFDDLVLSHLNTPFRSLSSRIINDPLFINSSPDAGAIRLGVQELVDGADSETAPPVVAMREFLDAVFASGFDPSAGGFTVPPFAYLTIPLPHLDVSQIPGLVKGMASSLRQTVTLASLEAHDTAAVDGLPDELQVVAFVLELRAVDADGNLVFNKSLSAAGPWTYTRSAAGVYEAGAAGAASAVLELGKAHVQAYLAAMDAHKDLTLYADLAVVVTPELASSSIDLKLSADDATLSF